MATLYLTEQGSKLGKTSRRLVVEKDKKMLLEIPEFKVDRVLIFGNVQITTQAIAFLLDNYIKNIESKETVKSLMGIEGIAASVYFRAYGKMFRRGLQFEKRQKRQ